MTASMAAASSVLFGLMSLYAAASLRPWLATTFAASAVFMASAAALTQ